MQRFPALRATATLNESMPIRGPAAQTKLALLRRVQATGKAGLSSTALALRVDPCNETFTRQDDFDRLVFVERQAELPARSRSGAGTGPGEAAMDTESHGAECMDREAQAG